MDSPPNSPFTLSFELRDKYLYAHLAGDAVSAEIIDGYTRALAAKLDETGATRVILYRDIPNALAPGEIYQTVQSSLDMFRGKKVAIVNPYTEIEQDLEFGVTVGINRGGNYSIFASVADAERWLAA